MTLNFSNSPLWSCCAASGVPVQSISTGYQDQPSDERQEGIAAAWLADTLIRGGHQPAPLVGELAPNGWPIDLAMMHHVQNYVEILRPHGLVRTETELSLWNGLVKGRTDAHALTSMKDIDHLRLWEFKYGYRIIEPDNNPQLILPALALVQPHHKKITLAVYQPRPQHPVGALRIWTISPAELQQLGAHLYQSAISTLDAKPVARPGHQCSAAYCPRAGNCPALDKNVYAAYEVLTETRRGLPLTGDALAAKLNFLDMLAAFLKAETTGTQAEAQARLKNGGTVGDWVMEARTGDRAWVIGPAMRETLLGINPYKEPKEKSPAEMEAEGALPSSIKLMTTRPPAGFKLARFNSKLALKAMKE